MTVPVACRDPVCLDPDFRLGDVVVRLARDDERREWDQLMDERHYLRYRQPFGSHRRYFLEDRDRCLLGCLLYDFAAPHLPVRDRWIGWQDQPHRRRLDRLVRQARFLLLPWVRVQCLASKALALSLRQLAHDWQRARGLGHSAGQDAQSGVRVPAAAPCLHPFHQRNPGYSAPTRLRGHLLARPLAPRLLSAYFPPALNDRLRALHASLDRN